MGQDGVCRKRNGVAECTVRVALVNRQVGVRQLEPPLHHTIAMLDSQIGWLGGQWPKKRGVAKMLERAAPQQQEGVLELCIVGWRVCAIFRRSGVVLHDWKVPAQVCMVIVTT